MKILINILLLMVIHQFVNGQIKDTIPVRDTTALKDTLILQAPVIKDTVAKKKVHSPRTATLRSAIIPGWGQIYNKKYWKVPIVYAAIGVPVYLFSDNKKWYNRTRYALSVVANDSYTPDSLAKVHPQLLALVERKASGSLINYRNEFRRNMDYSVLFTLLMWGLNVVDATVDGHLKGFDVGDDLSMKIKPVMMPGSMNPGISLVLNFK